MKLLFGDNLDCLKRFVPNSIDAVVTDPPYGLRFMNKKWDYSVPSIEFWRQVYRVLKPGGHVLSFGGTRTYHRMVVNIEDAGFEIRDQIMWLYGQGFPKSSNIYKMANKSGKTCQCKVKINSEKETQQNTEHSLRSLQSSDISKAVNSENESREVLQSILSKQSTQDPMLRDKSKKSSSNGKKPGVERGGYLQKNQGQLYRAEICEMSDRLPSNVTQGRLCNGTSLGNGSMDRSPANSQRDSTPQGPQNKKQQKIEFRTVAMQSESQDSRAWLSKCSNCAKPYLEDGFGTALKPANEPIVLARKPLSEKTIVDNVLKWGTGGINIDGCRVETTEINKTEKYIALNNFAGVSKPRTRQTGGGALSSQGRFPANIILDEVAGEMLDEQSGLFKGAIGRANRKSAGDYKATNYKVGVVTKTEISDYGGASRFFYCAKASKSERGTANNHPTVKPIKLMQYLTRLITPLGGTVLDPFMGSGTTGIACKKEGFKFVGIELNKEYFEIAKRRIKGAKNV